MRNNFGIIHIYSSHLKSKCSQLEHELEGEHGGENHVENVQGARVYFRLSVELHRERDSVDHNQCEYRILERLGGDEPPNFVLYSMLRYVSAHRFSLQRELDTISLHGEAIVILRDVTMMTFVIIPQFFISFKIDNLILNF